LFPLAFLAIIIQVVALVVVKLAKNQQIRGFQRGRAPDATASNRVRSHRRRMAEILIGTGI
jgi:FKBP-type peptidyl-prolyl cis-trans isomerase (trigger factor)